MASKDLIALAERDAELLLELIARYDQCAKFRAEREGERYGVAPIDCGGTNGSDHSYRLTKLVKLGLAEHRKRGLDWGKAPLSRRGSKVYRPTPLGREVAALRCLAQMEERHGK